MKRDRSARSRNQKGFTLIELMIVVGIIGILTIIAVPLYQGIQSRSRTAKAQADIRTIAAALIQYQVGCGDLPGQRGDGCVPGGPAPDALLVVQTNSTRQSVGPFFTTFPKPPSGWSRSYRIRIGRAGPGSFQVSARPRNGDNGGVTLTGP